ncbi:MAG TPA: carboxylesterase family protein [Polyangiaceae bacterium]|nr:carboxylesterase family protein [Polyangiaceae bacterium]
MRAALRNRVLQIVSAAVLASCSAQHLRSCNDGGSHGPGGSPDGGRDAGPAPLEVTTRAGAVRGAVDGTTRAFLGIPYAAPPVGPNRWRAPQPVEPWSDVRDATAPPKFCPQRATGVGAYHARSDEDCLTVNVWAPLATAQRRLPVMVWIHPGAFVFGSGAEDFYNGSSLVNAGNMLVVTLNYRLGALGFLVHSALDGESADNPKSGNYGFLDQQAALRWVQSNIAAFGGDPHDVTLFSESAGGHSTCAHLIAPGSRGLFRRAISESGICSRWLTPEIDIEYEHGDSLASTLGCTDSAAVLSCLRGQSPEAIIDAFQGSPRAPGGILFQGAALAQGRISPAGAQAWRPVVDGHVIPKHYDAIDIRDTYAPFVIGTNADEHTLFVSPLLGGGGVTTDAELAAALSSAFGAEALPEVLATYPAENYASSNERLNAIGKDAFFACAARRIVRRAVRFGRSAYLYVFSHHPEGALDPTLGAFHAAEFPFIFNRSMPLVAIRESERPLVDLMQGYWTRFARTGNPNGDSSAFWPKYSLFTDETLDIHLPEPSVSERHLEARCNFWDSLLDEQ